MQEGMEVLSYMDVRSLWSWRGRDMHRERRSEMGICPPGASRSTASLLRCSWRRQALPLDATVGTEIEGRVLPG